MKDSDDLYTGMETTCIIIIIVNAIGFIIITGLLIRIIKKVGFGDKLMLTVLFFLDVTLLCKLKS